MTSFFDQVYYFTMCSHEEVQLIEIAYLLCKYDKLLCKYI